MLYVSQFSNFNLSDIFPKQQEEQNAWNYLSNICCLYFEVQGSNYPVQGSNYSTVNNWGSTIRPVCAISYLIPILLAFQISSKRINDLRQKKNWTSPYFFFDLLKTQRLQARMFLIDRQRNFKITTCFCA